MIRMLSNNNISILVSVIIFCLLIQHLDEESGHHYYVNDATGETQWNRPGKE